MKRFLSVVFAVFMFSGVGFAQQTIKIGGIFDLTGATGDVGAPYAVAARDYINYVNKQGGVNGKKIELI
ncbi:MAG: ABC transporter substrate-binding protein, partial [Proteobacteria bacterium]|nr:ABC transporter substrate-binding protein [Pseudomonadota bacterium]